MIGVYKITNPNNQIYVGSSKNIERRFKQYKYLRKNEQHKVRNSILKYSYDNHKFEVIEECSLQELLIKERYYCLLYNVLDRTNLNLKIPKLNDKNKCYSQDVLDKMSKIHKGKKLSEAHKKVLITSLKGKKQTVEHINKRKMFGSKNPAWGNSYFKGKKHTEKTKEILSKQRIGFGLLGENNNSKKVIDIESKIIYNSAKEISILFNINYSTLKAYLNNKLHNKTNFKYLNK